MTIQNYYAALTSDWDALVQRSRNGTFLFERRYMDYHAERFPDASLLFYNNQRLMGVFPASVDGDRVISHGGLTYGGIVIGPDAHASDVGDMLEMAVEYYRNKGYKTLIVKPVPYIYHTQPSDDELYWLYRSGSQLTARGLSTAVKLGNPLPFTTLRKRKVRQALREGLVVQSTSSATDYGQFWQILSDVLMAKHGKLPVHCIDEILLLRSRFPENILLQVVKHPETHEILAGTLLFVDKQVVHAQYIAASEKGKRAGALDLLFHRLITQYSNSSFQYFDFGISTEDFGNYLNEGLLFQKEGFGGRSVVYDAYTIKL